MHAIESQLRTLGDQAALKWDLTKTDFVDSAGALLLLRVWGGQRAANLELSSEHEAIFARVQSQGSAPLRKVRYSPLTPIYVLGDAMFSLATHFKGVLTLFGQLVLDTFFLFRHPTQVPRRELSANIYKMGARALPITGLVGFLIGVVVSYLSAQQLQAFGADIYIINILGVAVMRELGPLLAAILIAGRSGSAMTAQLGVMRVTQELDALGALGISHSIRLVWPKVLALTLVLPLLILWTDLVALIGGMITVNLQLGISFSQFINTLPDVVPIGNLWLGVFKGAVFGGLIALIACHFGLMIKPNTESLGAGTTASVVTGITMVIIADAIFAILFSNVGTRFGG